MKTKNFEILKSWKNQDFKNSRLISILFHTETHGYWLLLVFLLKKFIIFALCSVQSPLNVQFTRVFNNEYALLFVHYAMVSYISVWNAWKHSWKKNCYVIENENKDERLLPLLNDRNFGAEVKMRFLVHLLGNYNFDFYDYGYCSI